VILSRELVNRRRKRGEVSAQSVAIRNCASKQLSFEDLRTVRQIAEANPGVWTEASLRWLIFNAEHNGMTTCIVKVGGRVLIDVARFDHWLESNRMAS
jgi:hypothetical protein